MQSGPGVRVAVRLDTQLCVAVARFRTCSFDDAREVASTLCGVMLGGTLEEVSRISAAALARLCGRSAGDRAARTVFYAKSDALKLFLGRRSLSGPDVVCTCFGISGAEIRDTIRRHRLVTVEEVKRYIPASAGCGTCRPDIEAMLDGAE